MDLNILIYTTFYKFSIYDNHFDYEWVEYKIIVQRYWKKWLSKIQIAK